MRRTRTREAARRLVEARVDAGERLGTDAAVFQEIRHGSNTVSARDAIHLAVMQRERIDTVLSFDRGFDAVPGLRRLG